MFQLHTIEIIYFIQWIKCQSAYLSVVLFESHEAVLYLQLVLRH